MAKNNEENDREIGYSYNWARQRQKRDYENIEKAVKMKKRIDKVLGKKKVLRRK